MADIKYEDLAGRKYGRLTVIKHHSCHITPNGTRKQKWLCKCECGNEVVVASPELKNGKTESCGCLQKERTSKARKTHGMSKSRLYSIWVKMIQRCENPNVERYPHYGGRGIRVCDEWHLFPKFMEWAVNNGYRENLSIDRIDLNKNYEPSNCRWATDKEQANNTSRSHTITYKGETHTISEWASICGIASRTLNKRINSGWNIERSLTEKPVIGKNQYSR